MELEEMNKKSAVIGLGLMLGLTACGGGMSASDYADKYGGTTQKYEELLEETCSTLQYGQDLEDAGLTDGYSELAVAKRMEELDC
jgi:hypothetical protein